ncbi:hypothetical protein BO70DRAFT_47464 [Aspergillus heteromorphus CBS 117.55]|uniref:Uncharacterized protein n=1 Tax=Aspergillus heteromorphus CBS 117.55 TaxID=1448321 RepID=A0A317W2G8_9EURO|nr:uncharacterized protein BO70DRAFT_47464 [Aspergillus heteromorphus CBS 117.55]PWY80663.1 hypothetical protein BO70DRAFT_47464 [Aspergillus heteromorphus CBS 117.55]
MRAFILSTRTVPAYLSRAHGSKWLVFIFYSQVPPLNASGGELGERGRWLQKQAQGWAPDGDASHVRGSFNPPNNPIRSSNLK